MTIDISGLSPTTQKVWADYFGTPSADTLAALRLVKRDEDLLDCLQALAVNFPQTEKIGDALLDLILILDDHLNN